MKRTPLKRKTKLVAKRVPRKKKDRSPNEFARVYGSTRRVEFVKALPCISCSATPCENAHIRGGGVGRKSGYADIVPLCPACHRLQHQKGWSALGMPPFALLNHALRTQLEWISHNAD